MGYGETDFRKAVLHLRNLGNFCIISYFISSIFDALGIIYVHVIMNSITNDFDYLLWANVNMINIWKVRFHSVNIDEFTYILNTWKKRKIYISLNHEIVIPVTGVTEPTVGDIASVVSTVTGTPSTLEESDDYDYGIPFVLLFFLFYVCVSLYFFLSLNHLISLSKSFKHQYIKKDHVRLHWGCITQL